MSAVRIYICKFLHISHFSQTTHNFKEHARQGIVANPVRSTPQGRRLPSRRVSPLRRNVPVMDKAKMRGGVTQNQRDEETKVTTTLAVWFPPSLTQAPAA